MTLLEFVNSLRDFLYSDEGKRVQAYEVWVEQDPSAPIDLNGEWKPGWIDDTGRRVFL